MGKGGGLTTLCTIMVTKEMSGTDDDLVELFVGDLLVDIFVVDGHNNFLMVDGENGFLTFGAFIIALGIIKFVSGGLLIIKFMEVVIIAKFEDEMTFEGKAEHDKREHIESNGKSMTIKHIGLVKIAATFEKTDGKTTGNTNENIPSENNIT